MNREEYLKLAAVEDSLWHFRSLHQHVFRELSAALGRGPAKILDSGCGTGGLIRRLGPQVPSWEWTGLDADPLACQLARERSAERFIEGSVEAIPFGDEEFDAVVSADVLCCVKNDQTAIHEMFRVLRPGGVLIANVAVYRWLWSYHDDSTHTYRRYEKDELRGKLQDAGFAAGSSTHWNALILPLIAFRRKVLPSSPNDSDVKAYPAWVDRTLDLLMKVEQAWIDSGRRWSFGSSELAVAHKPQSRRAPAHLEVQRSGADVH